MTLRIEREYIDVSMIDPREPDPDWRFVDGSGHEHRWVGQATPTLETREMERWWCSDCHDEHWDSVLVCKQCGLTVVPKTRPGPPVERIPGRTLYYLDDQPITKEEADALLAKMEEHR